MNLSTLSGNHNFEIQTTLHRKCIEAKKTDAVKVNKKDKTNIR